MDIDIPSHFLSVVLTEERESSTSASSGPLTSVISIGDNSVSKVRSPPPLLPLASPSVKGNVRKPWLKKEEKFVNKSELGDEEIWDVTKHLPKTLLAECTIEIHRTPLNRLRKEPQLCFDARVFPIFANSPNKKVIRTKKYNNSTANISRSDCDQNGVAEDDEEEEGVNNVFELIEAVYSDNDSEKEIETVRNDRRGPTNVLLKKHLSEVTVRNTPKINFKCEHCPNVYPNRGALWQHRVATHSVEKNCECKICGRKFYRNCSLALHLKSHSEEKLSACKECGKSFSKLLHLERHMKICSKYLATIRPLPFQNTTHVFKRRFVCTFCNKFFSQKSVFKKHLTVHVGENLKCTTCGIEFTQRSSLLRHLKRMHCSEPVKKNVPVLQLDEGQFSVVLGDGIDVINDEVVQTKEVNEKELDCNFNNHKDSKAAKGGGFGFYVNQMEDEEENN